MFYFHHFPLDFCRKRSQNGHRTHVSRVQPPCVRPSASREHTVNRIKSSVELRMLVSMMSYCTCRRTWVSRRSWNVSSKRCNLTSICFTCSTCSAHCKCSHEFSCWALSIVSPNIAIHCFLSVIVCLMICIARPQSIMYPYIFVHSSSLYIICRRLVIYLDRTVTNMSLACRSCSEHGTHF